MNIINSIIDLETGNLDGKRTLKLFSHLIKKDLIKGMQGQYGRTANALINTGYLDRKGKILKEVIKWINTL